MSARRIVVVSAGLSVPSSTRLLGDRLGAETLTALQEGGTDAEVEVVELRQHARNLADALVTGFPGAGLQAALDSVAVADGVVAVTPIFAASYSGLFKTFFDVLAEGALDGTPVLLAATAGTARHSLALDHAMRPLFAYLRAVPVPTGVLAATQDWGGGDDAGGGLAARIDRAAAELARLVEARPAAQAVDQPDDVRGVTPLGALLRGV